MKRPPTRNPARIIRNLLKSWGQLDPHMSKELLRMARYCDRKVDPVKERDNLIKRYTGTGISFARAEVMNATGFTP